MAEAVPTRDETQHLLEKEGKAMAALGKVEALASGKKTNL